MRYLLFTIFFLFSFFIEGQLLTDLQEKTIRKTIASQFGAFPDNFTCNLANKNLMVLKGDTLYNPDGYHYVFLLKNGEAKRLDESKHHGGNFNRYLFTWKNKMFSLGGYGFFTTNNNLIYFNRIAKGWTFCPTYGEVPPFIHGLFIKNKHFIYVLNSYKSGNSTTRDILDKRLYRLDLRVMQWRKFQLQDEKLWMLGVSYPLRDFLFFQSTNQFILFKHKTLEYLILKSEFIGMPPHTSIYYLDGNTVAFKDVASNMLGTKSVNFQKVWNSFKTHKKLYFKPYSDKKSSQYNSWIIVFVLGLFVLILLYLYLKERYSKRVMTAGFSDIHLKLLDYGKTVLSQEEFDVLLWIDTLEQDSKKLKRHRLVAELNVTHPNFVERIKDEVDKRRNLYKINK